MISWLYFTDWQAAVRRQVQQRREIQIRPHDLLRQAGR
jgi:hypothetical protein